MGPIMANPKGITLGDPVPWFMGKNIAGGKTDLHISELSYGAARGAADDARQFIRTVHAALDAGINLIDTAAG